MEIVSFRTPGLGDTSYLLTHDGTGVLVDPQRDIGRFLNEIDARGVQLRFVAETHVHNDYVSGAQQAALRTGAELVMPAAAAPAYRHTPAFHLEDLRGDKGLTLRPIHTPGHTPEHTSYLVLIDGQPVAVFSGGSLLVASAGRPDLLGPDRADTLARLQHGSLHRLAKLPREVQLLPTHGEGSFCTTSGVGRYTSTIGAETDSNPLLALLSADALSNHLLAEPPPIPAFYQFMGPANIAGVPPMPSTTLATLSATVLSTLESSTQVVDIRHRASMAAGFVPGSTGIELDTDFGSWAGWLLPYGTPIVLIADPGQDSGEAVTQLAQIGIDTVQGTITDLSGVDTVSFDLLDLDAFTELARQEGAQLLDVRMPSEHAQTAIEGAVRRFLPDLITKGVPAELDPQRPVLVACGSGRRAVIAATILRRTGYTPVVLTGAGIPELATRLTLARV